MSTRIKLYLAPFCLIGVMPQTGVALTVTQPTAATVVQVGDDYATQVLGNAWDMNDAVDIDTEESFAVISQGISGGVYSGTTTSNGANIYPVFMGYASSINLSRGANHPIDTSRYRYVTYKLRVNQASQPQFTRVIGLLDGGSYGATPMATLVEGLYTAQLPNNVWTIVSFDMVTSNDNQFYHWIDFPQLTGLRIDPATTNVGGTYANAPFNIDWIRLTAPATAAQQTTVQWTDSGYAGTYNIFATDSAGTGTSFTLASNVSGTSFVADTSFLPPGQYQIRVARTGGGGTTANSATFSINSPPQIVPTAPSARGDQSQNFAAAVVGNPWGPIDAADFSTVLNFTNVSYSSPVGSFYGRPTNSDPNLFLRLAGHTIDTNFYRSVCITMEVFGTRQVGFGSVARLFWGNSPGALTTSEDIVLDDNLGDTVVGEYCVPDLAAASIIDPSAPANGGTWSGTKTVFRLDPDELIPPGGCSTKDACHDVQLNSVVLSPFAQANPGYTFTWTFTDTDDAADTVDVYLDPDATPGNGNEMLIGSTVPASSGQYVWPGSNSVSYGTYHTLFVVTDGKNVVDQYGGGVIIVGARDGIFRNGFDPLP